MSAAADRTALRVLGVASEMFPLVKTGGLADVVGALPDALAGAGVELTTLLPGYPAVLDAATALRTLAGWDDWFGGPARLAVGACGAAPLLVLDAPHLYARAGNPYLGADGLDWPDNARRFAALAAAAAEIGAGRTPFAAPDLVHSHDWQAALVPTYLSASKSATPTVLTIHNLAFQGQFPMDAFPGLALPADAAGSDALEWYGDVNFLKAGLLSATAITTVSPTYAREILASADGMGLDAILRWRDSREEGAVSGAVTGAVTGIVNGIDTAVWDPAHDAALVRTYAADTLDHRVDNKRVLEARFGLPAGDGPLFCMISRLTTQKGVDLVVEAIDRLVERGARFVVLGAGDRSLEQAWLAARERHPGRVGVVIGYDEALSHRMQAGADAIVVPSRFEPCGLTQLCGLRYGCVPVVARVGGLADTVIDANEAAMKAGVATGVHLAAITVDGLIAAVGRAMELHREPESWRRVQRNGMRADVGWSASAATYAALYRRVLSGR